MPEISVIVPAYKAEAHINRCVDSILAQTFADFELILVDDGSPDRSGVICDEYAQKDPRVRVIHKSNGGVSSARNAGLDAAEGNWVTFVDSDDYVTENYLSDLYHPEYDLSVVGHVHYTENSGSSSEETLPSMCVELLDSDSFVKTLAVSGKNWLLFCWGRLFNAEIIRKNRIRFDETLRLGEDYVFSAQYLSCCTSLYLGENLSYIHTNRIGTLSKTFDIPFFENLVRAEHIVSDIIYNRFQLVDISKSEEELTAFFADSLCQIALDPMTRFSEKYKTVRYLFDNLYFQNALADTDRYFGGISRLYKMLLETRSPFLILLGIMFVQKIKG